MSKTLKFTLLLTLSFLLTGLFFAPRGQILAQNTSFDQEIEEMLPKRPTFNETINSVPGKLADYFREAVPLTSQGWQEKFAKLGKVLKFEEFKNFSKPLIDAIGKIKDSVFSFINKFIN